MMVINNIIELLSQEPFTLDSDGYIKPTTQAGERLLEKLKEEFAAFTHPDGNNLSDSRLLVLRSQGFELKLIHDDELNEVGYAIKIQIGWVSYNKGDIDYVRD